MKNERRVSILWLFVLVILLSASTLLGVRVELREEIKVPNEEGFPSNLKSFCVTQDEVFFVPDFNEGTIKVYVKNENFLELVNSVGQKGFDEDGDLGKPAYCFYNEKQSKFGVIDYGLRKIFIYDRTGRTELKRVNKIPCLRLASDIQLIDNRLYISGARLDNNKHYELYYIDLTTNEPTYLLEAYEKFGVKDTDVFNQRISNFLTIGVNGWFDILENHDIQQNDILLIWEGSHKWQKIDAESGDKSIFFGTEPPDDKQPKAIAKMIADRQNLNISEMKRMREKLFYTVNIFASSEYVIVVSRSGEFNYKLQFFNLNGDYIKEEPLPGQHSGKMWFDKDKHFLYSLSSITGEDGENLIYKFQIKK